MAKVTVTFNTDSEAVVASSIVNAVRRATGEDKSRTFAIGEVSESKGVTIKVAASPASATGGNLLGVRDWARKNGFEVGKRGRIHADVLAAYAAAN